MCGKLSRTGHTISQARQRAFKKQKWKQSTENTSEELVSNWGQWKITRTFSFQNLGWSFSCCHLLWNIRKITLLFCCAQNQKVCSGGFLEGVIHQIKAACLNTVLRSMIESSSGLFGFNNLQATGPRRGPGLLVVVILHGLNQRVEPGLRTDSVLQGAVRHVSRLWWKHIERRHRGT